ncbi:MAG: carbohydrate ABC transporter permease [Microbacterium sp.]
MSSESLPHRQRGLIAVYVLLSLGAIIMIAPYVTEVLTSLKTYEETVRVPPAIFPAVPMFSNYLEVSTASFPIYVQIGNSLVVALARIAGQVLFCSMAAFAFARLRFRFRNALFALFLSVLMVPSQLFLIPQYQLMQQLNLLDTLPALFLPGIFSAFGVFLLRQFFLSLPADIEEAARLDGANPWQIYWRVLLPLTRPALAALALLTLVSSWSDLLWPLIVNSAPDRLPISVGLANLVGEYVTPYQIVMAGAVIASAPVIVIFLIGQRQFIQGLQAGAVK